MNPGEFLDWLEKNDACEEAREWVAGQTLRQAWANCPRLSWMLWLVRLSGVPGERVRPVLNRVENMLRDHIYDPLICDYFRQAIDPADIEAAIRGAV